MKYIMFLLLTFTITLHAQWQKVGGLNDRVFCFESVGDYLLAGTEDNGIYRSQNSGNNFIKLNTNLSELRYDILDLEFSNGVLWAGAYGGGVCRSTDYGNTWESFNSGFVTQAMVTAIEVVDDTIYAAVEYSAGLMPAGIYKTSVNTDDWIISGYGIPPTFSLHSFTITGNGDFYAAASIGGSKGNCYISKNSGVSWTKNDVPDIQGVLCFETYENRVFAGAIGGVFIFNPTDESWEPFGDFTDDLVFDDLLAYRGKLYAACDPVGVTVADIEVPVWDAVTSDLPNNEDYVSSIYIVNNELFASLSAIKGLWKNSEVITGIGTPQLLEKSDLSQNYPNPFNPSTVISYSLAEKMQVILEVYDILGRKVASLVNIEQNAGNYEQEFIGTELANGIYFARLNALNQRGETFSKSVKMILLK